MEHLLWKNLVFNRPYCQKWYRRRADPTTKTNVLPSPLLHFKKKQPDHEPTAHHAKIKHFGFPLVPLKRL
jgi:hypothetical protein